MKSCFLYLSLIGMSAAAVVFSDNEGHPVIIPEPRQISTPVIPEPRQQASCSYSFEFPSIGSQAYVRSPGYPNSYPAYSNCQYTLKSPAGSLMKMTCNDFNLEASSNCAYDVFYFSLTGDSNYRDSVQACGKGTFERFTSKNALSIRFTSDAGNPYSTSPYRFNCLVTVLADPAATTTAAPSTTAAPATSTAAAADLSKPASNPTCECGVRNESPRIVGGVDAGLNEFPWRASLYSPEMGVFCGATIISDRWVVTAAHCTKAVATGTALYVDVADHNIQSSTESVNDVIKVSKIVQHATYNTQTQDNDISLLQLERPLNFSRTVQPVCLPFNMVETSLHGTSVVASGWGTTSSGGSQPAILQKVELPVLTTEECQKYYQSAVTSNMFCTYSPGKDTCQGDSGGSIDYKDPNTGRYYNLGVVSWGVGCAGVNQPGVYAKVTNYLSWIQSQTGETYCNP